MKILIVKGSKNLLFAVTFFKKSPYSFTKINTLIFLLPDRSFNSICGKAVTSDERITALAFFLFMLFPLNESKGKMLVCAVTPISFAIFG